MSDSNEPAKITPRVMVWLSVGAIVITVGVFFLAASTDSQMEEAARSRTQHTPSRYNAARTGANLSAGGTVDAGPDVFEGEVAVEIKMRESARGPVAHGATNLPDQTTLRVTIEDTPTGGKAYGQTLECSVRSGHYEAGPFYADGASLAGEYAISVRMPDPSAQPEEVQAIIGKEGEHLAGPLVHPAASTPETQVVEQNQSLVFGGEAGLKRQAFLRVSLSIRARRLANQLEDLGKRLEEAERGNKTTDAWPSFVRDFQQRLGKLRFACDEFPQSKLRDPFMAAADHLLAWARVRSRYGQSTGPRAAADRAESREAYYAKLRDLRVALKALQID